MAKTCENCGTGFRGPGNQRFCSTRCRVRAFRTRRREELYGVRYEAHLTHVGSASLYRAENGRWWIELHDVTVLPSGTLLPSKTLTVNYKAIFKGLNLVKIDEPTE